MRRKGPSGRRKRNAVRKGYLKLKLVVVVTEVARVEAESLEQSSEQQIIHLRLRFFNFLLSFLINYDSIQLQC